MQTFRVALIQAVSGNSQEANLKNGLDYLKQAKSCGADLALFPELWNVGYRIPQDMETLKRDAIGLEDMFLAAYGSAAKALGIAVAVTYLERFEPAPRNAVTVFDRFGRDVLSYAKVHTCDFGDERVLTPGDDFYVSELDTESGNVKIGAMICYDREFPESARILMLKGAEIILIPNACPMDLNRLSQLRARAFENMVGVATANYAFGQPDCNGHSSAFDGIAYGEVRPGSVEARDTLVIEAGGGEGVYLASFPIDTLRDYRVREVHGNAYRRPSLYGLLVSEAKSEPFLRDDFRKRTAAERGDFPNSGTE